MVRRFFKTLGRWLLRIYRVFLLWQLLLIVGYKYFPVPVTSTMLQRQWQAQKLTPEQTKLAYQWVSYSEISDWAKLAVIALEDNRFATHHGVDWAAMRQALAERRGGSTITQQVVKNALLWQGKGWNRYLRKILELPLSLVVDRFWGKRRVLEIYLNIIEVGPMTFGVEMASQNYFGRSAAKLTLYQSALVAASLPNPLVLLITKPNTAIRRRQAIAVRRIRQLHRQKYLSGLE